MKPCHLLLSLAALALIGISCARNEEITVDWIEGRMDPVTQRCENTFVIKGIPRDAGDWGIWFGLSHLRSPEMIHEDGVRLRHIGASLYRIEACGTPSGDDRILQYRTASIHYNAVSWFPMHLMYQRGNGKLVPVKVNLITLPPASDGEKVYDDIESARLRSVAPEEILPQPKRIEYAAGGTTLLNIDAQVERTAEPHPAGWYRLTLDGGLRIVAADDLGERYARMTLSLLRENAAECRNLCIEDWPDFPYRALMLNASSSFVPAGYLRRAVDLLARYKMNVLHLHLTDDGGWRLEIPQIPELTSWGAHKGIPRRMEDGSYTEDRGMMTGKEGCYDSDADHVANGFLTREDYVDVVRYAASKGITVLPEIDFPAHSQAAIIALKAYEQRTGDASYRPLASWAQTEVESVQGYRSNTWDISLPSTYRFITLVFNYLKELHAEAGQPLTEVHTGGDEVPVGTWDSSEGCRALLEAAPAGADPKVVLHSYYVNRLLDAAEACGLKIAGWHELAEELDEATSRRLASSCARIHFWGRERMRPLAWELIAKGFPVVMCNCERTYMDNMYSDNREEAGLGWCGSTDDRKAWGLLPLESVPSALRDKVVGVQASNWISNPQRYEGQMLPKVLAVFDRCWNAEPRCALSDFRSIVAAHELPFLSRNEIPFHIAQPGLKFAGDTLWANSPIPGAEIRYITAQGTPDENAVRWEGPVALDPSVQVVSARLFYDGKQSVTTTLRR